MSRAVVREAAPPRERAPVPGPRLWFTLLGGPLALLALQEFNYATTPWSCQTRHVWVMHLASLVALLVPVATLVIARRERERGADAMARAEARGRGTEPLVEGVVALRSARRVWFMATVGVLVSALFIATTIAMWIPVMVLDPCARI